MLKETFIELKEFFKLLYFIGREFNGEKSFQIHVRFGRGES